MHIDRIGAVLYDGGSHVLLKAAAQPTSLSTSSTNRNECGAYEKHHHGRDTMMIIMMIVILLTNNSTTTTDISKNLLIYLIFYNYLIKMARIRHINRSETISKRKFAKTTMCSQDFQLSSLS